MKDRILEFLRAENKSSIRFAEEIGVQPSGISHILSGRNNPSLDFVLKMLGRYKYLSTDWLLFGKGSMYKDGGAMQSLFDQTLFDQESGSEEKHEETAQINESNDNLSTKSSVSGSDLEIGKDKTVGSKVERIVWFYSDGGFTEYLPRK